MVVAALLASHFGGYGLSPSVQEVGAGIGLIVGSQLVAAVGMMAHHFPSLEAGADLAHITQLSPLKVVGAEGVIGLIIMVSLLRV
jgi:hypothetical protein